METATAGQETFTAGAPAGRAGPAAETQGLVVAGGRAGVGRVPPPRETGTMAAAAGRTTLTCRTCPCRW